MAERTLPSTVLVIRLREVVNLRRCCYAGAAVFTILASLFGSKGEDAYVLIGLGVAIFYMVVAVKLDSEILDRREKLALALAEESRTGVEPPATSRPNDLTAWLTFAGVCVTAVGGIVVAILSR